MASRASREELLKKLNSKKKKMSSFEKSKRDRAEMAETNRKLVAKKKAQKRKTSTKVPKVGSGLVQGAIRDILGHKKRTRDQIKKATGR